MLAFGERIREIRLSKNLTQERLANKADVAISTIARIEGGDLNASITLISKLADAFDVDKCELMKF
jgi:transcriptional regulator with XRE-family HTH domain